MTKAHRVVSKEIGQLRIYLPLGETRHGTGLRSFFGRPLFRELIDLAKADGILNATSHATHYGYSNQGKVQSHGAEVPNPQQTICLELIDHRDRLKAFCQNHSQLLKGRILVYKHLEHWELHEHTLDMNDATTAELQQDGTEPA